MEEEAQLAVGSVASDMLRENKELFLPLPALPPSGVIRGLSDCELLIQRFAAAVRAGMDAPTVVPGLDEGIDPSSPVPLEPVLEEDPTVWGWDRVCFSCGHQGHGVNRCSRIDTSFPFLSAGWSISVRNGRYRSARTSMDGRSYTPGKGGWSGWEGQPPASLEIVVRLTLGGGASLATTNGGRPWISLDPRCPGLSGTGACARFG